MKHSTDLSLHHSYETTGLSHSRRTSTWKVKNNKQKFLELLKMLLKTVQVIYFHRGQIACKLANLNTPKAALVDSTPYIDALRYRVEAIKMN